MTEMGSRKKRLLILPDIFVYKRRRQLAFRCCFPTIVDSAEMWCASLRIGTAPASRRSALVRNVNDLLSCHVEIEAILWQNES
jgi:hypothetical protein